MMRKWMPSFLLEKWVADQYEYVTGTILVLNMLKNTFIFAGRVPVINLGIYHFINNWNDLLYPRKGLS